MSSKKKTQKTQDRKKTENNRKTEADKSIDSNKNVKKNSAKNGADLNAKKESTSAKNAAEKQPWWKSLFDIRPKRIVTAVFSAAVILVAMALAISEAGVNTSYVVCSAALAVLAAVFVLMDISYGRIISAVIGLVTPVVTLVALENYTHVISDLSLMIIILNLLFFYALYGMMTFLLGSVKRGFLVATLIPMIFGLANYFVVSFRGSPIVPWDFFSIGTAASVADNYTFTLSWKGCFSVITFVWIILISSKSRVQFRRKAVRIPLAAAFVAAMVLYISGIQNSAFQSFFGMDTTLFTINVFYRNNGIAAAFLGNLRFLNVEEPDGYSVSAVTEIAKQYAGDSDDAEEDEEEAADKDSEDTAAADAGDSEVTQYPNIIVIMDEAFSDLSVWGDFATSEEVMPFFKSLQEEAIGGEVYVSVKGGNTANTEYEFLTGDTMGFLPTGSVPYQQYIKSDMPSLASYLGGLGYDTLAIHPYNASGWDRDDVYDYFGFDDFLDKTDFDNPTYVRNYISDSSAFDKIIEQYEEKEEEDRLFVFEVTMQNHSGYSSDSPGFDIYVELTDVENKTTQVTATEKYLTLMNMTDKALQELVEYFEEEDEPTIILMFGDHQPSDYITNQIRRICGVSEPETVEEIQQGYRVPFVIWANYDLESAYYDGISVNYLSGILLEAAGVPLTDYQTYLSELMETLPVINGNVYRDADGNFYAWDTDDTYDDILNAYQMLQYNHLVDTKHRLNWFFGLGTE
ncbi:MAG: LTA synthase family protein [Lachnospiraceae bacterium]|nr:LTA synthase family protein [Lachnospiraceae bacterium]